MLSLLNKRSREIFRLLVNAYCQSGEPVGSRTVAEYMGLALSPATIRNVMAQLEELGLLYSPHPSAGRIPTETGLRLFIDGFLEIENLDSDDRQNLESQCDPIGKSLPSLLHESISALASLSKCASLVLAPKYESTLKHLEFVALDPGRALVVLVTAEGLVENRIIEIPLGTTPSTLMQASNFINVHLANRTLGETLEAIQSTLQNCLSEIDELLKAIVETGLGVWAGDLDSGQLIIRGHAQLLKEVEEQKDLEKLQHLFEELETKKNLIKLLEACCKAEGVQIFIGSSNSLFTHAGCAMVVAPYHNRRQHIVGAIAVIGPTHINYARIIPMVNYTSQLLSRSLG